MIHETRSTQCHVGIHAHFCIHLAAFTYPIGPSKRSVKSELGPALPSPPTRVLETEWSGALSLVCEVALTTSAFNGGGDYPSFVNSSSVGCLPCRGVDGRPQAQPVRRVWVTDSSSNLLFISLPYTPTAATTTTTTTYHHSYFAPPPFNLHSSTLPSGLLLLWFVIITCTQDDLWCPPIMDTHLPPIKFSFSLFPLMPRSHQTFRSVSSMKSLGVMFRNRCWPTTFPHCYSRGCQRMVFELVGVISPSHTHTCARNCRSLPYACRYMIHMTPPLQTRTIKHLYITWVCGPYVITLLYHAHVFEWYMAKVCGEEMALNEHVSRWNLEYVLKIWIAS